MPRPSSPCYSEGTGRTGQLSFCEDIQVLQKKKILKKNNPTVQGPQPCPLKYAVFIKTVKSDFKKNRIWIAALDLGLMNKIQKQNKGCFHNGWREREPVQLQNLDPGTEGVFVCKTCGNGWQ